MQQQPQQTLQPQGRGPEESNNKFGYHANAAHHVPPSHHVPPPAAYHQQQPHHRNQRAQQRGGGYKMPPPPDVVNNSRYSYVLAAMVGETVQVVLTDHRRFEGIVNSAALMGQPTELHIVLSCARELPSQTKPLSGPIANKMVIRSSSILSVSAENVSSDFSRQESRQMRVGSFRTGVEIGQAESAQQQGAEPRALQQWLPDGDEISTLEDSACAAAAGGGTWDQFEVNERMYNVKSTYAEELYTTPLDVTIIPQEVKDKAERIAQEIEQQQAEKHAGGGQFPAAEDDEEAMYGAAAVRAAEAFKAAQPPLQQRKDAANAAALVRRGMLARHFPRQIMQGMNQNLVKNINALNLEPALPRLFEMRIARPGQPSLLSTSFGQAHREADKAAFMQVSKMIAKRLETIDWEKQPKRPAPAVASRHFRFNPNAHAFTPSMRRRCGACVAAGYVLCTHLALRNPVITPVQPPRQRRPLVKFKPCELRSLTEDERQANSVYRDHVDGVFLKLVLPRVIAAVEKDSQRMPEWNEEIPPALRLNFSTHSVLGEIPRNSGNRGAHGARHSKRGSNVESTGGPNVAQPATASGQPTRNSPMQPSPPSQQQPMQSQQQQMQQQQTPPQQQQMQQLVQPQHMQPQHMQPQHMQPQHTQPQHMQPQHMQPQVQHMQMQSQQPPMHPSMQPPMQQSTGVYVGDPHAMGMPLPHLHPMYPHPGNVVLMGNGRSFMVVNDGGNCQFPEEGQSLRYAPHQFMGQNVVLLQPAYPQQAAQFAADPDNKGANGDGKGGQPMQQQGVPLPQQSEYAQPAYVTYAPTPAGAPVAYPMRHHPYQSYPPPPRPQVVTNVSPPQQHPRKQPVYAQHRS